MNCTVSLYGIHRPRCAFAICARAWIKPSWQFFDAVEIVEVRAMNTHSRGATGADSRTR